MHEKPPVADLPVYGLFGGQLSSAHDAYGDLNGWFRVRVTVAEDFGEFVTEPARSGHDAVAPVLGYRCP